MSAQLALAALAKPADQPSAGMQHCRQLLLDVIDMAADIARRVHAQAMAQDALAADSIVAFDRVTKCLRRNIMLAHKLEQPPPATATAQHPQHRAAVRRRIIRAVEDTIQREADEDEADALQQELLDRLDAPDIDDDITGRPVGEIIADICRDLGLTAPHGAHPWKRRTPEDMTVLCARAAAPSSPGASALGSDPPQWHAMLVRPPPNST